MLAARNLQVRGAREIFKGLLQAQRFSSPANSQSFPLAALAQSRHRHSTYRIDGVDQFSRLAKLHEALSEIVEGALNQHLLLFVVVQQVIPERLLGESLGVSNNYYTISRE